jgi:hypothetical protein
MALRVENAHELTVLLISHLLLGRLPARRLSKTCKGCYKPLDVCPFCLCCYWPTESISEWYWTKVPQLLTLLHSRFPEKCGVATTQNGKRSW